MLSFNHYRRETLSLQIPTGWTEISPSHPRITACFQVKESNQQTTKVLVTISHLNYTQREFGQKFIKGLLTTQIAEEKDHMVETDVCLHELTGTGTGFGYYFMATDRNWKKPQTLDVKIDFWGVMGGSAPQIDSDSDSDSDWPYLVRCCYLVDHNNITEHTMIEMTILCYDQSSETIQQAFDFLKVNWDTNPSN